MDNDEVPQDFPVISSRERRGSATAAVRAEALGQLRWWLTADTPVSAAVVEALASLVDANFPLASRELPFGSTLAAEYKLQLLAAFDGIISAAEAGADVGPALQARALACSRQHYQAHASGAG